MGKVDESVAKNDVTKEVTNPSQAANPKAADIKEEPVIKNQLVQ